MKKILYILITIFSLIIFYLLSKYFLNFDLIYLKSKLVILIILVFFIFILLFGLKKKKITESVIVVFSFILAFYLIETLNLIQTAIFKNNKSNDIVFKTASKYDIHNDLLSAGTYSSPTFSLMHLFDDKLIVNGNKKVILSMQSHTKMIHCYRNNEWIFFKSDRYGFNNLDFYWDNYDTVIVGDSFGVGECVPNEFSIAKLVNNSEKIKGLVNLSQTGNGPLLELATFLEYADHNKTKNLIWLYYEGNDLYELNEEIKITELLNYLKKDAYNQNLKKHQLDINSHIKKFIVNKKKIVKEKLKNNGDINTKSFYAEKSNVFTNNSIFKNLINFIKLSYFREKIEFFLYIDEKLADTSEVFFEIIFKANKKIKSNSGNFYFVYLPAFRENYNYKQIKNFELSQKKIINRLREKNIEVIDIYKDLYLKKDNLNEIFDKTNGHYTLKANREISEIIKNKIRK